MARQADGGDHPEAGRCYSGDFKAAEHAGDKSAIFPLRHIFDALLP
jgi:hypothetical protein